MLRNLGRMDMPCVEPFAVVSGRVAEDGTELDACLITVHLQFSLPYRALYSRNVSNLFMAGRNISVDREGLGPVRVMRTTGMMGEIVGKAAWIAVRHDTTPRGVHERHLPLLRELMAQPGAARRDSLTGDLRAPSDAAKVP